MSLLVKCSQQLANIADSGTNNHDPMNIHWEFYSYLDPFESDWLPEKKKTSGILIETTDFEPVDYFYSFFPEEAFKLIAEETTDMLINSLILL